MNEHQPVEDNESSRGIQVLTAPSDAPRVRWRTDLIAAGFTAALLAFLVIVAGEGSSFDRNTLEFVGNLPGWLLWLGQAAYVVGLLYSFGLLIGVGLFARAGWSRCATCCWRQRWLWSTCCCSPSGSTTVGPSSRSSTCKRRGTPSPHSS